MRSKLFVPGSRPELFAKAMASEADGLSFDLEDAVDESMKGKAREEVARFLRSLPRGHGKTIIVRVNGLDTPHFAADIRAVTGPGLDIVNLPKPDSADDVKACARAMNEAEREAGVPVPAAILVNIETPKAYRHAAELAAASPRVIGLQAGWGDLIEPLDIDRYNLPMIETLLLHIRIAAGESDVWAYDGAWANFKDTEGMKREAEARGARLSRQELHPSLADSDRERCVSPRCRDPHLRWHGSSMRRAMRPRVAWRAFTVNRQDGRWTVSCAAPSQILVLARKLS